MIEATYTLTTEEFVDAHKVAMRAIGKRGTLIRRLLIAVIALALAVLLVTNHFHVQSTDLFKLIFPVTLLVILLISPWLQTRATRKAFHQVLQDQFTDFHLTIDDERYCGESPGKAKGEIMLTAFTDWQEGAQTIALIRLNAFYPIPKRILSTQELAELKTLLGKRIPKRK